MHTSGRGVLRILEVFKDALYKGNLLSAEEGVTILLAKTALPTKWGATCPITLSSAEAVELMLLMRRVARAVDMGLCELDEVWFVDKALYGLRESPKLWGDFRDAELRQARWVVEGVEYCLQHHSIHPPDGRVRERGQHPRYFHRRKC